MQTLLLSNELAKRGIETHVVLHNAEGEFLDELDPAVNIHNLGVESHLFMPLIAIKLDRVLGSFDSGLVIVKLWSSLLATQLAVAHRSKLAFAICEDLDPLEHWRQIKLGSLKRRLIRPIFKHSPIVLANTDNVADRMVMAYNLESKPRVIYGGISIARIRELALRDTVAPLASAAKAPLRIVTVASLRLRKGHSRILNALCQINIPWEWHIVGDGPEMSKIRAQLPVRVTNKVFFHGAQANPYPQIIAADVLVHLPYSEAFGIVILEALALGTPVVSSPSIGPIEISQRLDPEQRYLKLVDPTDASETARTILDAARRGLGAMPQDIVAPFDVLSTADSWMALAESTLSQQTYTS